MPEGKKSIGSRIFRWFRRKKPSSKAQSAVSLTPNPLYDPLDPGASSQAEDFSPQDGGYLDVSA